MIKACIRKTRPIYLKSIRYKVNVAPEQLYELIAQRNSIYLSPGFQEIFRELRNDQIISPYRQTQSKKVSVFVAIHWKMGSSQHFEKIYRTDLETLTGPNLFTFCPESSNLKTWPKKISLKNSSEMFVWVLIASLNFTFVY